MEQMQVLYDCWCQTDKSVLFVDYVCVHLGCERSALPQEYHDFVAMLEQSYKEP